MIQAGGGWMACMRREKNDEMNSNVKNRNKNVGW